MINKIVSTVGIPCMVGGVVGALLYMKGKYVEKQISELTKFKRYNKNGTTSGNVYISGNIYTDNPVLTTENYGTRKMVVSQTKSFRVENIPYLTPIRYDTSKPFRNNFVSIGSKNYFKSIKLINDTGIKKADRITLDGLDITNIIDRFDMSLIEKYEMPLDNSSTYIQIGSFREYKTMIQILTYGILVDEPYTVCGTMEDSQFDNNKLTIIHNCSDLDNYIENKKLDIMMYNVFSTLCSMVSLGLFIHNTYHC